MTLIIAVKTTKAVLIASDMRISANGVETDDESVKCGFLRLHGGPCLFAYTGLAFWTHGTFRFEAIPWLTTELHKCSRSGAGIDQLAEFLRGKAEEKFAQLRRRPIADRHLRLSVIVAGFEQHTLPMLAPVQVPKLWIVSNFQALDGTMSSVASQKFAAFKVPPSQECAILGATQTVSASDIQTLTGLVARGLPVEACVGKAEDILRQANEGPRASSTVGPNMMLVTIGNKAASAPHVMHRSHTGGDKYHLLGMSDSRSEWSIAKVQLNFAEPQGPLPHRNSPCPCGSGKKYKKCHGSLSR